MQKIIPHLWFDTQAKEAAEFYTSFFPDSHITDTVPLHNTPSGEAALVELTLAHFNFMFLNAGPDFKFNPSISFVILCSTKEEVDMFWNKLSPGGSVLMELSEEYPFSEKFGWLNDKYGVSWQVMHTKEPITQKIVPAFLFVKQVCGRSEEAIKMYTSIFKNSHIGTVARYPAGGADKEGTVMHADFTLEGELFWAMDSALDHKFAFNEAVSLLITCDTQEEIDYYWDKLSADPNSEQCGWLKDKFGISWQVNPRVVQEMLKDPDQAKTDRVTQTFLKMKKFDIAALKKAYEG